MRIGFCFILITLSAGVFAQSNSISRNLLLGQINTTTTAVPFLLIAPDARAAAIGEAGAATSADANSIHWNPAKIAFAEKNFGFSLSYAPWLRALVPDIYHGYLSGYKKLKGDHAIAGSLRYFFLGNSTFTGNAEEFSMDVAYARKLGDDFSGGLALRYINSNLAGGASLPPGSYSHPGNAVAADISVYYKKQVNIINKYSIVTGGLNISNIGAKISYSFTEHKESIPTNFRLGAGLKIYMDEHSTLTVTSDINKLMAQQDSGISRVSAIFSSWEDAQPEEFTCSGGLEYWYDRKFALRAGYFNEEPAKGNRKFFTTGAGVKYEVFSFDFAYLVPTEQRSPLENTIRFTLLVEFDSLQGDNEHTGKNSE